MCPFSVVIKEFADSTTTEDLTMPQLDPRVRLTSRVAYENCSSKYSKARNESICHENRRVVSRTVVCAGSLRVRSCKLLWKPAVLQLMVTSTTSLSEDESHFDDCHDDFDDPDDNDIDKSTTVTCPNTTNHYSLVFCHRSLMGHARRERIELNSTRYPVELVWGKDGMMSTQFEFSIVYGERRCTLICRARDAKDYLQWTNALRAAMASQGKKCVTMSRLTQTSSYASSKSSSSSSNESCFGTSVVHETLQLLEQEAASVASTPTPTFQANATATKAIKSRTIAIAEGSALIPVPANIAAAYVVGQRRKVSVVANSTSQSVGIHLRRRKQSRPSPGGATRRQGSISMTVATLPPSEATPSSGKNAKPRHRQVTVSRPSSAGRQSSAARGSCSSRSTMHARKTSLFDGTLKSSQDKDEQIKCTSSRPKSNHMRVLQASNLEEKCRRERNSSLLLIEAVPMMQSPSLTESPLFIVDERPTTVYVNSASSAIEQSKKSRPVTKSYKSDKKHNDARFDASRNCSLNLDMSELEDESFSRSNRGQTCEKSWAAYLEAMECEL